MKIYNTLTRQKEEFKPISAKQNGDGVIGIYSCGPTVYWNQHIGHMYAYVQWELLVRFLRFNGFKVKWVMNVTDVGHMTSDEDAGEDKMEKGAKREGLSVWEVAKKYEKQFLESMDLLNIVRPDVICRATEHIDEQIELAKKIEKNGFSYITKTGLVFDTAKFPKYADFAKLKLEEMNSGSRVEIDKEKKNPWDFLLWVTNQPDHIMKWDSPWGSGFPGWHLECTAMSTKYLGENFDIHTGGIEHIGVHHTNEIAQGYGAFGHNTANYWVHNAWLTFDGAKMSKSLGNVILVSDLVKKGFDPLALRYLILSSSYRKGLDFSFESLESSQVALNKLRGLINEWLDGGQISEDYKKEFIEFLSNDLSTSEVLALVWKLTKDENIKDEDKKATILDFDKVLGLYLDSAEQNIIIPDEVIQLNNQRLSFKKVKNYIKADKLREKIKSLGYLVEDLENTCKIKQIK